MPSNLPDYAALFKQVPAAVAVVRGPEYIFEYVNEAYAAFIGHSDLIGKTVRQALPEVVKQGFIELLDAVYTTGVPYIGNEVAIDIVSKEAGEPITSYLNFIYQPVRGDDNTITGIFAHVTDVTELVTARLQTEQLHHEAEQEANKFHTVLDALDDHVYYFGPDERFQYGNRSVLDVFGFKSSAELAGKHPSELLDAAVVKDLVYDIQQVIKTGRSVTSTSDYTNMHGVHNYYEYIFSPIFDAEGTVTTVVGVSRNVNNGHEAKLLKAETVTLKAQRNALKAMNNVKDDFISVASHQLRTPATAVKQYLGMLLEGYAGDVPPDLEKFIRTAYTSNDRQLTIINDLLKTARIDSSNYAVTKKSYDVCQLVQEVIDNSQPNTTLHQQKIRFTHKEPIQAQLDGNEFKLAVENLLENASKYSPAATTIEVAVRQTAKNFSISVQDKGVGIAAADISKIFDKFSRINNRLSDTVTGTGLGLYFVKRIVDLHGGTIGVKSEIDKGTMFTITLPK